jgi:Uncharacterized BCR, YaiI/YqxD family COG1671
MSQIGGSVGSEPKVDIYVDGDACPVREEIFRVAARLRLNVLVVSNGSRPIRPSGTSNVRMVLVGDSADESDDWFEEHISAADTIAASHRMRRKLAVTQVAARDLPTSANATFRPPPSGTVQQRLCGKFVGSLGPEYYNSLILMASPRGFEPLLPP